MTAGGRLLRALLLLAVLFRLVPVPAMPATALPFQPPICHSDPDGTTDPARDPRNAHDCALCPVCLTASGHISLADAPPAVAPTATWLSSSWPRPPATGPPAPRHTSPHPTGPPA